MYFTTCSSLTFHGIHQSIILFLFFSALAHVLLGQFKTAIIMILATIIFGSTYSALQLLGAAGAILAILFYSQVTIREKEVKSSDDETKEGPILPLVVRGKDVL